MDYKKLAELLFPKTDYTREELEEKFPLRNLPEGAVVTRMAPSPTGFVHLGNFVQALASERIAHQSNGVLFLRIEDTDKKREVDGAVETVINSLKHYSVEFDEGAVIDGDNGIYGPYRQRQRVPFYHTFAKELVEKGLAYPCFCTEEELADIHSKQEKEKANFGYYGKWAKWRDRSFEEIEENIKAGMPYVLRFRSEGSIENKIKFTDLIKGNLELTENDIDHVLLKSDGVPTYHFAHVVDDHLMRTTHVVRGDEWISTLPFHIQLFKALDFKIPKYLHIGPLMIMDGDSKRKLSKRKDPQAALTFYEKAGYPVESIYEYLMTVLNSNFEDWRRANKDTDAHDFKFSYKKMNPAGSLFDEAKLNDVSKNVISCFTADKVVEDLLEWSEKYDGEFFALLNKDTDYAKSIFAIGRGGKQPRKDFAVWSETKAYCSYFYDELFVPTNDYPKKVSDEDIKKILNAYLEIYDEADDNTLWFDKVKSLCEPLGFTTDMKAYKQNPDAFKGSVADVSTVIRVAVTGRQNTPDLCTIMKLLGKERSISRIKKATER